MRACRTRARTKCLRDRSCKRSASAHTLRCAVQLRLENLKAKKHSICPKAVERPRQERIVTDSQRMRLMTFFMARYERLIPLEKQSAAGRESRVPRIEIVTARRGKQLCSLPGSMEPEGMRAVSPSQRSHGVPQAERGGQRATSRSGFQTFTTRDVGVLSGLF